MSNQRIRLFVTGRVQGVFFRQTLKTKAIQNDVFGWVKNLKDGRVEAVLEGNEENVSRLVEWAHGGPANAIVEDVEIDRKSTRLNSSHSSVSRMPSSA